MLSYELLRLPFGIQIKLKKIIIQLCSYRKEESFWLNKKQHNGFESYNHLDLLFGSTAISLACKPCAFNTPNFF